MLCVVKDEDKFVSSVTFSSFETSNIYPFLVGRESQRLLKCGFTDFPEQYRPLACQWRRSVLFRRGLYFPLHLILTYQTGYTSHHSFQDYKFVGENSSQSKKVQLRKTE